MPTQTARAEIVDAARQVAYDHRRGRFPSPSLARLEAWCRELDIAEAAEAIEKRWQRPCRSRVIPPPAPTP